MRLIFRVDASLATGTGHVMRCSAIIEEAVSRGIHCVVIGRLGGFDWLEKRLKTIGAFHIEDQNVFEISSGEDVLVLDSYDIPVTDSFIQPQKWKSVVSISDAVTPNYNASLVIHPGIDSISNTRSGLKFLTGPEFIPFRKSIRKSTRLGITATGKIVVFGGGTDKFNFALAIAQGLKGIKEFESAIFISSFGSEITCLDSRFEVKSFGLQLDLELENADLVFTTASTSSLEIVAREIPLGVCFTAINQVSYFDALIQNEIAVGIGNLSSTENWELNWESVNRLVTDSTLRTQLAKNSSGYLDLLGSERIVNEILKL
jgi:spore coat polysaccharide biosynthesis predicted glycosyltransferase SpsG